MTPRADKNRKCKKFSKCLKEIVQNSINLLIFSVSVASNGGGGGGGNSAWGKKWGGVSQQWRGLHPWEPHFTPKYKSPKQFELKQSWKALRALKARWALPVYPVFEDEKSKASDKKIDRAKNRIKKTDRTNIIATNFVWEQLKKNFRKTKKNSSMSTCTLFHHSKQMNSGILVWWCRRQVAKQLYECIQELQYHKSNLGRHNKMSYSNRPAIKLKNGLTQLNERDKAHDGFEKFYACNTTNVSRQH